MLSTKPSVASKHNFEALGTKWQITFDQPVTGELAHQITTLAQDFDRRFSRFLLDSEVSRLNSGQLAAISPELQQILDLGLKLKELTGGAFDPYVGHLLEARGYGPPLRGQYPKLDLGGWGKGWLIDTIAQLLKANHYYHFLINGGGDIYATTQADFSPYSIAIEHPFDSTQAIATLKLANQAIATSTSQVRKFNGSHHLLDSQTGQPVNEFVSVTTLAQSAAVADGGATAIFVSHPRYWSDLARHFQLEYLVVKPDLTFIQSPAFPSPFAL